MILAGCNKESKVVIKGTIENAEKDKVALVELAGSTMEFIDSVKVKKNGDFKTKVSTDIPRYYLLKLTDNKFITLALRPGEEVDIAVNTNALSSYEVIGSEWSSQIADIFRSVLAARMQLDSISKVYESALQNSTTNAERINQLNSAYTQVVNEQRDSLIAFIVENLESFASIYAVYQKYDNDNYFLYKNRDIQYVKIVGEALEKKYTEAPQVKALLADKNNLLQQYSSLVTMQKVDELTKDIEVSQLPEIKLPNEAGDSIRLSEVKAKVILLSFWATWSKESIVNNIEIKDLYKQYHPRGFEIYQVSLDTKRETWEKAINFEQIPWISVIDEDGRNSYYARLYNVSSLPTTFLIKQGEVITRNPSMSQLKRMLNISLDE